MRAALVCILVWLSLAPAAMAREVIERFVSNVVVNADASLDVTEEITVNAEGNQIRRGIFRDFPTDYRTPEGSRVRVGFSVKSVERDGAPEAWAIEDLSNGKRIRIGRREVFLEPGRHVYVITYHTTRQLGFFPEFDELYWNATGNGWSFPILYARANVTLPDGAEVSRTALYTGYQGANDANARVVTQSGSRFSAETTAELQPAQGFTIAIGWQKGLVAAPTERDRMGWWLSDNAGYALLAATLLVVSAYFGVAWLKVGRDPPRGTIVPLFYPPEGLGPAGVRYVWKQRFDNRAFAAAVVGLAVKGRVKIQEDGGEFTLLRQPDSGPPLEKAEAALYAALPVGALQMENTNHAAVSRASAAIRNAVESEYSGTAFVRNFGWFAVGAAISVAGLIVSGLTLPDGVGAVVSFAGFFSAIWWGVILSVAYGAIKGLWASRKFLAKVGSIMQLLFLVPFVLAGVGIPAVLVTQSGVNSMLLVFVALAATLGIVNFIFYKLMPAPTAAGRGLLDKIEGFRMYMTTAEERRLDALHPPEKTPELFERYLPYAMALDCENQWNDKFAAVLAAAAAAGATAPIWYSGSSRGWSTGGFADSLSNGLASSVSSASTPPGSTSGGGGSGGGGFSGGGGGGGGGGGW